MHYLKKYSLLFVFIFLFSCSDNVKLSISDIEKYSWLTPFTTEFRTAEFEGTHNIDLGTMNFSFKYKDRKSTDIFMKIDSVAYYENWSIEEKTKLYRKISKFVSEYEKDSSYVSIIIRVDTLKERVFFKVDK